MTKALSGEAVVVVVVVEEEVVVDDVVVVDDDDVVVVFTGAVVPVEGPLPTLINPERSIGK